MMNPDITDERLDQAVTAIKKREEEADNVPNPYDMLLLTQIEELKERGRLLADARRLLEPLEWIDDGGRQCAWCEATRWVPIDERNLQSRDNHRGGRPGDTRKPCKWLAFMRATESLKAQPKTNG